MDAERGIKNAIEKAVRERLKRSLTPEEKERILKPRGLIGYEAILDSLKDERKTITELEEYLRKID